MGSWKTSIGGLVIIAIVAIDSLVKLYKGTPLDFQVIIGLVTAGATLMYARDNTVSDQEAGVRPETKP